MSTISERIRLALDRTGMKQIDLAKKTGINRSNISYYCSGEYEPKGANLQKIASALGVTVAWLIDAECVTADPVTQAQIAEIDRLAAQMTPEQRLEATRYLEFLLSKK